MSVRGVLGEELCKGYIAAKKQEWESYSAQVSQWRPISICIVSNIRLRIT